MYTSAGFVAGIAAAEFVFAIVLFGVMSATKPPPAPDYGLDSLALVEPLSPGKFRTPTPEPTSSKNTSADSKGAPQPSTAPQAKSSSPKPDTKPKTKGGKPGGSGGGPAKKKKSGRPGQKKGPTALAKAMPKPEPLKPQPTVDPLGLLVDPMRDCRTRVEEDGALSIIVPNQPHIYDPDAKIVSAPRALVEVDGDFMAEVKVSGEIKPGTKPVAKAAFTFQGAGLVLWQDEGNYVRFERTSLYSVQTGPLNQLLVENCKEGRMGQRVFITTKPQPLLLRMARKGTLLTCTYSYDGKTWLPAKKWEPGMSARVNVGISASNLSPRSFTARFEDLRITKPTGKAS